MNDIKNESRIPQLINKLAEQCLDLPQPIHVIAICSGGRTVGQHIVEYLNKHGVKANYFEAWTNIINNKAEISITDFSDNDYVGTALIAEDVTWTGTSVKEVKKMLKEMRPKKKAYLAVLLDMNRRADFSIFN